MTAMEEDIDDRFAGIDIDTLLNRVDRRPRSYGRKACLYEAPEFIRRLNGEETVMEGQSLCLDCKVIGFPAPSLRWFKDDEEIVDHPRIRVESDSKGHYYLYIDKVNKGDEAAYRCRAENVEGASSCFFFLSVRCKPKSKKKRDKSSSKKRSVSFPPMFSTIVEKVEEEDKLGKEQEIQPPSPMTQFYYALTLKGRQTWPSFLGDWAFRHVVVDDDDDDDNYDERRAMRSIPNGHGPDDVPENLSGRALIRRRREARSAAKRRRLQEEEDEQAKKENKEVNDTKEREKSTDGYGGGCRETSEEDLRKKEEEERELKQREEKENERRKREAALRQRRLRREQKAQEEHDAKVRQAEEEQKEKERLQKKEEEERIEKERREEEERTKEKQRKLEEQRKREAERKEEERRREEEKRKREELRQREDEKRKEEEKKKKEERRKDELRKIEEEKRAEEKRKEEERQHLLKLKEENRRKDEERRKEERARENEKKQKEEEQARLQEEMKRKAAEKKRREEEEKMKEQEEKKRQEEKQRKFAQRHVESGKEETEPSKPKPINQKNVLKKFAKFLDEKELKAQGQTLSPGIPGHTGKNGSSGVSSAATKFKTKLSNSRGEIVHEETSPPSKDIQWTESSMSSHTKHEEKNQKARPIDIPLQKNVPNQKLISSDQGDSNRNEKESKVAVIEKNEVKSDMKGERKENVVTEAHDEKKEVLESNATLKNTAKKATERKEARERLSDSNEKEQSNLLDKGLRKEEMLKEKIKARQRDQEEMALKQQKQREHDELRLKQQRQKEELKLKMEEEDKRLKEKQEREQKEARLRSFMKEKIRQQQLQRQYEEEKRKKKEREEQTRRRKEEEEKRRKEEKARKAEEKRLDIARRAELEKDLFEVKIYKRDYSFADLRKSLEGYGGGELLNPEEHKYWDDILEKHNYSISDLKSVFDLSSNASTSQERPSRLRVRRNSVEGDSSLERVKRSGSLSDIRDAYTKSLDRPKKNRSEKKKKQSEDEFLKRSSSISDLKQLFASSSSPTRQQTGVDSENAASSKTPGMSKSITEASSSQASPKLELKQKSSLSSHVELKKLAVNVAAKRASFHEMVTQVQQRNAQDISQIKERARKRASLHGSAHGYDSYGSKEIPAYKRLSSWSDDMEATKKQDRASALSPPSSQSSSRPMSPNDEKIGHDAGETTTPSSRVRPFVYNSIRTIARKTDTGKGEDDTTLNDNDDVFEKDNSSSTPVFYLDDENESDEPKNKKIKKQTQMSTSNTTEANKENVLVKPHRTQTVVKTDVPNHEGLIKNVAPANSVSDDENKPRNRICLHAPLRKEDDSKVAIENDDTSVSPGIFLEYIENEEMSSHAFQREEREPTPFFKTNKDRKEIESPFFNQLQPLTPPGSAAFEREPTPFFDKAKRPESYYLEDNSSSESSPDREVEAIEKPRSHFLTVPTKAAFTFEGPVRAPRDSTPTPFLGNPAPSDPILDNPAGLRPPRESTPFFPKEEDDGPNKVETRESLHGSTKSTPGKDTNVGRNQSGTNQSKAKADLQLTKEDDAGDNNKNTGRHSFDQVDRQKQLSSDTAVDKNDRGDGMKFGHSSRDKGEASTFKVKISGNSQNASATSKTQRQQDHLAQQDHNLSDNSNNAKGMLSRESKVSNLPHSSHQKPASEKAGKATSDMSTHRNNSAFKSIPTTEKGALSDCMGQPSNITTETVNRAVQMSPKSNKQPPPPADAKTSNSSESSVAAQKAAAAQARRELYRQRKLQADQTKNIEAKRTSASKEEATQFQTSITNSRSSKVHNGESKDLISQKPLFKSQQTPDVIKPNQQSVIQSSLSLPKPGQNRLNSTPVDQVATTGNSLKLKSALMTHETPSKLVPHGPVNLNSSMSNAKPQQMTLTAKSSELPKPTKLNNSSPTTTKMITPATMVVKSPLPTPVSLAKAAPVVTSPLSNLIRDKRSPSPKPAKDSVSRIPLKPQNGNDASNTGISKKLELCKLTQLPLPSLHPGVMRTDIQNPKPKTSPTRPKVAVSSTATKNGNVSSQREKGASSMQTSAMKSVLSSSSKAITTSASAQPRSSSSVLMSTQPSLKTTKDKGGEHVGDKNVSHKISKASNLIPTRVSHNRFSESSQRQQTAQQVLSPKPASLSLINPIPQSPVTGFQNKMPVSHRLEVADKNKTFRTAKKSSPGIVNESREQNIIYHSTLWSKLLKAFMNSFVNEVPLSKEEIRKPPKRRKAEKSKDPRTSKGKSKVTRGKFCDYDWTKVSPFGQYTLEGVFLGCIMTLIALSADVRIEVFICYILAAYYTFFVLRVLKILD